MNKNFRSAFENIKATKSFRDDTMEKLSKETSPELHTIDLQPVDQTKQTHMTINRIAIAACMAVIIGMSLAVPKLMNGDQASASPSVFLSATSSLTETLSPMPLPTAMNGSGSRTLSGIHFTLPDDIEDTTEILDNQTCAVMEIDDEFYFAATTRYKDQFSCYCTIYHYDLVTNSYTPISDEVYGVYVRDGRFIYSDDSGQCYSNNTKWNDEKKISRDELDYYDFDVQDDDITVIDSDHVKYSIHIDNAILDQSLLENYSIICNQVKNNKLYFNVNYHIAEGNNTSELFCINLDGSGLKKLGFEALNAVGWTRTIGTTVYMNRFVADSNTSYLYILDTNTDDVRKIGEVEGFARYFAAGSKYLVYSTDADDYFGPHILHYCPLNE